jgi:hypothetical protein
MYTYMQTRRKEEMKTTNTIVITQTKKTSSELEINTKRNDHANKIE